MVRLHTTLRPRTNADLQSANRGTIRWIHEVVAAMKEEGVYTTVSPYWTNTMRSDDERWGVDWDGNHNGLLFFDEDLQQAYKAWLRELFTTPSDALGGRTLAEEPALGIFQIQNEDSLLFWTVDRIGPASKIKLGRIFADWASQRYGSLEKALEHWDESVDGDDLEAGVLGFQPLWLLTGGARREGQGQTARVADQAQFFTETMRDFNTEIVRFVREDLNCPVLVNPGNWKTADQTLLMDLERYSYTPGEVSATNRYFGGIHKGPRRGWAVLDGDTYTNDSALTNAALDLPINLKQTAGQAMMVTESAWVFPNENASEAPFLIAAYSSLTGFDAYYWFQTKDAEWTHPGSANGHLPSAKKWIFATPDMAGLFPAAALLFRKGYLEEGEPVLVEHRSPEALWTRKSPLLAETAGFDPNRDAGDLPTRSAVQSALDPHAFLVGPARVVFDSDEAKSRAVDLEKYIREVPGGMHVQSITGEIELNTAEGWCTINAPKAQGVAAHFERRGEFTLDDVHIESGNAFGSVLVVSLDDRALRESGRILVQAGTRTRPTDWATKPATIEVGDDETVEGLEIVDYGQAPWRVESPKLRLAVRNTSLTEAVPLDANGMPVEGLAIALNRMESGVSFDFPETVQYVLLR